MSDRTASWNKNCLVSQTENRTLVNLLRDRASQYPNKVAYTFLEDGEHEISSLTYQQLDQKARTIAAYLQSQLTIGDRVLLVYPQGLEAIVALFGCLYAGMIAIPAPAPETSRLKRTLPRLEAIAADAGASLILTTASLLTRQNGNLNFQAKSFVRRLNGRSCLLLHYYLTEEAVQKTSPLAALPWIATENIPGHLATSWQPPHISGDTLAYLQYTSGSTSTPKGVMLDHANLMGHLAALQQAGGYSLDSITVTWMPYFHDYGLVEGILEPLYNSTPCYLMSPAAFIKRPLRWLQAISKYRVTHSQAPNFAYAYCLRRITSADRDTIDLSQWQAAGNAAEPINPEVIEEFCQTFESCGFRRHAFAPAYGLAETTLLVTTSQKSEAPVFCTVDGSSLAQNRIVETATGQRLAGSGRLLGDTQIVTVHPESLTRCAADEVGEIWVASVGVARGYWHRPDATQETFKAHLADTGEGPFLRTGDLGFIKNGELFITGRLKDLIIIRGENYYPQDIEWVVERSHSALRPGYGAAFAVEIDGVEQLVIAVEVDRSASKSLDVDEVAGAIRNAVAEHYELPIYGIALLKRGSIPKTSSGKIQRQTCRSMFLDGSLSSLVIWTIKRASSQQKVVPQNQIEFQLVQIWQRVLGITSISTEDNFFELGGDSLKAAILLTEIEQSLGQTISLAALAEELTIEKMACLLTQNHRKQEWRSLIPIKPDGYKRPFFYVHGADGYSIDALLAHYIDRDRPFYGLQAKGLYGEDIHTSVEEMAEYYIQAIQTVQPQGPYLLGGRCTGGTVAFEMAQKLRAQGQQVLAVALVDSINPLLTDEEKSELRNSIAQLIPHRREQLISIGLSLNLIENVLRILESNIQAAANYRPKMYSGQVVYFTCKEKDARQLTVRLMRPTAWKHWIENGIEIYEVPGGHITMTQEPHVQVLAEELNACLEAVS